MRLEIDDPWPLNNRLYQQILPSTGGKSGSLSAGDALPVLRDSDPPLVTPFVREEVIRAFTFQNELPRRSLTPIGGDTNLLFNVEYRIPIAGPLSVAAFGDIGSAFNLRRYDDQVIISNPVRQPINPLFFPPKGVTEVVFGPGGGVVINPDGRFATREEIEFARLAQGVGSGVLPNGFTNMAPVGLNQTTTTVFLSQADSGWSGLKNYRASVGLEFRFQVPVINLPLRLIYAYNPNARVNPGPTRIFPEERSVFRLSFGRTF
jgi:outer membrane protein insertion porin family